MSFLHYPIQYPHVLQCRRGSLGPQVKPHKGPMGFWGAWVSGRMIRSPLCAAPHCDSLPGGHESWLRVVSGLYQYWQHWSLARAVTSCCTPGSQICGFPMGLFNNSSNSGGGNKTCNPGGRKKKDWKHISDHQNWVQNLNKSKENEYGWGIMLVSNMCVLFVNYTDPI